MAKQWWEQDSLADDVENNWWSQDPVVTPEAEQSPQQTISAQATTLEPVAETQQKDTSLLSKIASGADLYRAATLVPSALTQYVSDKLAAVNRQPLSYSVMTGAGSKPVKKEDEVKVQGVPLTQKFIFDVKTKYENATAEEREKLKSSNDLQGRTAQAIDEFYTDLDKNKGPLTKRDLDKRAESTLKREDTFESKDLINQKIVEAKNKIDKFYTDLDQKSRDELFEQYPTLGFALDNVAYPTLKGTLIGIKAFSDLLGADTEVSKNISNFLEEVSKKQSSKKKEQSQRMADVAFGEADGIVETLSNVVKGFLEDPLEMTFTSVGIMGPTVIGGVYASGIKAVQVLGAQGARMFGLAKGADFAARRAALATATQVAGGVASGTALGTGLAKGAIYDTVYERALQEKYSEQDARRIASEAQSYTENGDVIALVGIATGLGAITGVEPAILNAFKKEAVSALLKKGIIRSTVTGIAKEVPLEFVQGSSEKYSSNVGLGRKGFDVDPTADVLASGLLEGVASIAPGAVAGAAESNRRLLSDTPETVTQRALTNALNQGQLIADDTSDAQFATRILDSNSYNPALIDPSQTAMIPATPATDQVTGLPSGGIALGDGTISFTPNTNLTAQAGLTPIVMPDPATTALPMQTTEVDSLVGSDIPSGFTVPEFLNINLGATPSVGQGVVVEEWLSRSGDGFKTERGAQGSLEVRQRMFPELNWQVEEMPNGKYRLAGYSAETVSDQSQLINLGEQDGQMQGQGRGQTQVAPEATPAMELPVGSVTGRDFINNPAIRETAQVVTFNNASELGAVKVGVLQELESKFERQDLSNGNVAFIRIQEEPSGTQTIETQQAKTQGSTVVTPSPQLTTTPAVAEEATAKYADFLNKTFKRVLMETKGQDILDTMDANNVSPKEVASKFWTDTYYKLPAEVQKRFTQELEASTGMKPGSPISVDANQQVTRAENWMDIADLFISEMADTVEYLEGTERGFTVLMDEANRRFARDETQGSQATAAIGDRITELSQTQEPLSESVVADLSRNPSPNEQRVIAQKYINDLVKKGDIDRAPILNAPDAEAELAVNVIGNVLGDGLGIGNKVIAFSDPEGNNGFSFKGFAFVNTFMDGSSMDVPFTTLHEIYHVAESMASAGQAPAKKFVSDMNTIFDDMTDVGKRDYVEKFLFKKELDKLYNPETGEGNPKARQDKLVELMQSPTLQSEMVADFLANRAQDREFLLDLAATDPQGFEGFVRKWLSIIDNLIQQLRGGTTQSEKQSRKVDLYVKDLNKAKMVARDALIAFRKGNIEASAVTETQTDDRMIASSMRQRDEVKTSEREFKLTLDKADRETKQVAGNTAAERAAVEADARKFGLSKQQAIQMLESARETKKLYPQSDGWAPLEVVGITVTTNKDDGVVTKIEPKFKAIAYGFNRPIGKNRAPAKIDTDLVNKVADQFEKLINDIYQRAEAGDKNAQIIISHQTWYRNVAEVLRRDYGAQGDLLADLLGATSPNTPVDTNWKFSIDILHRFMRGEFNAELSKFDKFVKEGGSPSAYPASDKIRQASGMLYGMNSTSAMSALLDIWRVIEPGSAPKARNFALNLIGQSNMATIDVWAARMLRRAANMVRGINLPRIPPPAEKGVTGTWNASVTSVTGEFGFGDAVMQEVSKRLAEQGRDVSAPDLQAIAWFAEKELWGSNRWTTVTGEGGSFEENIQDTPVERYLAGWSIQRGEKVPESGETSVAQARVMAMLVGDDSVIAARVMPTYGLYGGVVEQSFDTEWTVEKDKHNPIMAMAEIARLAQENDQYDIFVSRVISPTEENANARPGVEIYFRNQRSLQDAMPILERFIAQGQDGFTMAVDPRAKVGEESFIGVRLQYVPEIAARFDENARSQMLQEGGIESILSVKSALLEDIASEVSAMDGVAFSQKFKYDTVVIGKENYDAYITAGAARVDQSPRGQVWFGQPVRQAVERAVARYEGEQGSVDTGRVSSASDEVQPDLRYSRRERDVARPTEPVRGSSARPDARLRPNTITGIHYGQKAGLSQLRGSAFGTGIKGAEQERLSGANVDPRIKRRVYFYVATNDATLPQPEVGLGTHVYRATLSNMYDASTASTLDKQRIADLRTDTSANAFESAVLDAGYQGYVNRDNNIAVVLNANVPVAYEGIVDPSKVETRTAQAQIATGTRVIKDELVRRPTSSEMLDIIRTRSSLQEVAPSFALANGEARVNQFEASLANDFFEDNGIDFRFDVPAISESKRERDSVELDKDGLIKENPRLSSFDIGLKRGVNVLGLFESATDKLRRSGSPILKEMATRVDRYFDQVEARNGKFNGRLRPALRNLQKGDLQDFEQFWKDYDNGRVAKANKLLAANPRLTKLVSAVRETFDEAGSENQRVGVKVFDAKTQEWRLIGRSKDFWPRVIRPEIARELQSGGTTNPELWNEMLEALMADGKIESKEEASKYIRNYFTNESSNDYFAGIEKARGEKLPEMFYDYSWEVVPSYAHRWAQRLSQIENFGQVTGANTKDFFDKVKAKTLDPTTAEYINAIQQRVYDVRQNSTSNKIMANLNMYATGTQLGNPATATLNLIGGTQLNVQMFGYQNVTKALAELARDYEAIMQEGTELGILGKDTLSLMKDHEVNQSEYLSDVDRLSQGLRGFTSFTMKWGGYNATEQLIRATAFVSAKGQLNDALNVWANDPTGSDAGKYNAFMERNRIDKDALIREQGIGEETAKYLRLMVNIPQGSYKIDQTPIYVDTPAGRFFFKYQKFGTQVSRMFWEQNLQPMLDAMSGKSEESRVDAFTRLIRWFATAGLGGTLVLAARSALFGALDAGPDREELEEALKSDDNGFKMMLLFERAWTSLMAGSAFGFFGNYAQMTKDVYDQQRVKDPLSPPALAPIITIKEAILRLLEQGKLTARDIDDLATQSLAIYRSNKRLAASGAQVLELEIDELQLEQARRDVSYVRKVARWYAKDAGLEGKVSTSTRFGMTENTPVNRKIHEAILLNDPDKALDLALQEYDRLDDPDEWKKRRQSIMSALSNRHPARISQLENQEARKAFEEWVEDKMPQSKQDKLFTIIDNYEANTEFLKDAMP